MHGYYGMFPTLLEIALVITYTYTVGWNSKVNSTREMECSSRCTHLSHAFRIELTSYIVNISQILILIYINYL